ncbi:PREDICTED: uncharacterized protein LOC105962858 [Erythranthe guttata]|uniref:uncharacterized protein LOC105962858 n=1 Tax=Erythranthe guttata TaxID=4155 RepID=UPI00064D842B|nr:PREDICTED: uncharacterized protein LOC105962858 [Erythranthe guttata]|eukprot:XP_012842647.1 PREDICTED: uncharacterized protein LOC105962858 [Erythranthe guttata]
MSGTRTQAQNAANDPHNQSRTIQDLTALVGEQNEQINRLVNLQNRNPHPPTPPRNTAPQAIYERFLKMHPTEFHGGPNPTKAEEWIKSLEVIFEYMVMNDSDQIHCALFLLKNKAQNWWKCAKNEIDSANTTWEAFKVLFFEKYFSKNVRAQKLKEFIELNQGNLPVTEFTRRFEQGSLYASFIYKDDTEKMNHYLRDLNPIMKHDVRLTSASTFHGVVDKALEAKQDEMEIRQWLPPHDASSRPWKKPKLNNAKRKQPSNKPFCPKCNREHSDNCVAGTNYCFRFKQPRHMVRDCPIAPRQVPSPTKIRK